MCVCVWGGGGSSGHKGRISRDPHLVCTTAGFCGQFWLGQGGPLFDVVHPAVLLPTLTEKDSFGEAVLACDMIEPCKDR